MEIGRIGVKMKDVLVIGSRSHYKPHKPFGPMTQDLDRLAEKPDSIALIVLEGGPDIDPSIYGHKKNPKTFTSPHMDLRDNFVYDEARKHNIPMVGICRGGQLLVAKAGGFLYQHATGHHGDHMMVTAEGKVMQVTSCHHQMFGLPLPEKSILLAWAQSRLSDIYEGQDGPVSPPTVEPEIVYHPQINSLSVQYHPEWMSRGDDALILYQRLISNLLLSEGKKLTESA